MGRSRANGKRQRPVAGSWVGLPPRRANVHGHIISAGTYRPGEGVVEGDRYPFANPVGGPLPSQWITPGRNPRQRGSGSQRRQRRPVSVPIYDGRNSRGNRAYHATHLFDQWVLNAEPRPLVAVFSAGRRAGSHGHSRRLLCTALRGSEDESRLITSDSSRYLISIHNYSCA